MVVLLHVKLFGLVFHWLAWKVLVILLLWQVKGSALLSLIERQQWIAHSISEYIDIAVSLTKDLQFLQQNRLQQYIDRSQSILCDSEFLANNLIKIFNELLHK